MYSSTSHFPPQQLAALYPVASAAASAAPPVLPNVPPWRGLPCPTGNIFSGQTPAHPMTTLPLVTAPPTVLSTGLSPPSCAPLDPPDVTPLTPAALPPHAYAVAWSLLWLPQRPPATSPTPSYISQQPASSTSHHATNNKTLAAPSKSTTIYVDAYTISRVTALYPRLHRISDVECLVKKSIVASFAVSLACCMVLCGIWQSPCSTHRVAHCPSWARLSPCLARRRR